MQDRRGKAVLHGKLFPNKKPDQLFADRVLARFSRIYLSAGI
jgi:hypothetical protein